jgi:hypothetical protein
VAFWRTLKESSGCKGLVLKNKHSTHSCGEEEKEGIKLEFVAKTETCGHSRRGKCVVGL